jgi:hypothetical protein
MLKGRLLGIFALFVIGLGAFSHRQDSAGSVGPNPRPTQGERDVIEAGALKRVAHQLILAQLKDPGSAIFSYDLPRATGLFCGKVRARNSFGGYGDDIYYILFPFGVVTNEREEPSRFERVWDRFCFDKGGPPPTAKTPNHYNEVLTSASASDQAWMLGKTVGGSCSGHDAYFMGSGKSGISKDWAFWSVRCSDGREFEVGIPADGPAKILECSTLESLRAGKCFRKIDS